MHLEKRLERMEKAIMAIANGAYGNAASLGSIVYEILNPPDPKKFLECDTCRAKPGSPTLCKGCLHNRSLIESLSSN